MALSCGHSFSASHALDAISSTLSPVHTLLFSSTTRYLILPLFSPLSPASHNLSPPLATNLISDPKHPPQTKTLRKIPIQSYLQRTFPHTGLQSDFLSLSPTIAPWQGFLVVYSWSHGFWEGTELCPVSLSLAFVSVACRLSLSRVPCSLYSPTVPSPVPVLAPDLAPNPVPIPLPPGHYFHCLQSTKVPLKSLSLERTNLQTHTVFGESANPGIIPLSLRGLFDAIEEQKATVSSESP
jgi:hypothetical protein